MLQDAWCASASEGALWLHSQLPHSLSIGEQTSGCFAGSAPIRLPFESGVLKIGTYYCARNKNGMPLQEKEGIPADISVASSQAFLRAQMQIENEIEKSKIKDINLFKSLKSKEL